MTMQPGAEGVFVGSGIFKSGNPAQRAEAIVKATTFYDDPDVIAKVSRGLGEAIGGINVDEIRSRTASPTAAGDRPPGQGADSGSARRPRRPRKARTAALIVGKTAAVPPGRAAPPARAAAPRRGWRARGDAVHDRRLQLLQQVGQPVEGRGVQRADALEVEHDPVLAPGLSTSASATPRKRSALRKNSGASKR